MQPKASGRGVPVLFSAVLAGALLPLASAPARPQSFESKLALETALEKRLQNVISEMLGTENVVVVVNVTLRSEEEERAAPEVLPGVPLRESPTLRPTLSSVAKIAATVFVEPGLGDKETGPLREVAGSILGLDDKRGDTLEFRPQRFRDRQTLREGPFTLEKLLRPPQLWHVLWLALALVALLALPRGLAAALRQLAEAVRALPQAASTSLSTGAAEAELGPAASGPTPGPQLPTPVFEVPKNGNGRPKEGQPFGFIRESHLQRLLYLLKKSPPEITAVVVNYLPPDMASRVLGALDAETRRDVAASLGQVVELSESNVRRIEQLVASKIDFLVGGADRLLEILEHASGEVQERILESVAAREPALAEQLRRQLVQISDMAELDAAEILHVMRRVPMAVLAPVVQGRLDVIGKMAEKLPQGMSQRLMQEVDLARPLPPERLSLETRRVIEALKQLAVEGWIVLKKSAAKPVAKSTLKFTPAGGKAQA